MKTLDKFVLIGGLGLLSLTGCKTETYHIEGQTNINEVIKKPQKPIKENVLYHIEWKTISNGKLIEEYEQTKYNDQKNSHSDK